MQFFGRRIEDGAVKTAAAVLSLYLTLFAGGAIAISMAEGLPLGDCLFETASAVATVGVTLGITPGLGIFSQIILIMLMFMGRVGCLTLIYAAVSGGKQKLFQASAGKSYGRIKKGLEIMKNILLIGLGRFGKHIAMQTSQLGHQIMAVDSREERINEALPYVTDAQIGDSTNQDFLKSLGVGNYDVCIVTIGGDFQSSLETTSLLKELGAKKVVSRAEQDVQEVPA